MVCRLGGTPSSRGVLGVGLSSEAGTRAGAASVRPSGGGVTRKPHPGQLLRGATFPFPLDLGRWPSTDAHPPAGVLSEKLNLGHKLRGWGPREALRARPAGGGLTHLEGGSLFGSGSDLKTPGEAWSEE